MDERKEQHDDESNEVTALTVFFSDGPLGIPIPVLGDWSYSVGFVFIDKKFQIYVYTNTARATVLMYGEFPGISLHPAGAVSSSISHLHTTDPPPTYLPKRQKIHFSQLPILHVLVFTWQLIILNLCTKNSPSW